MEFQGIISFIIYKYIYNLLNQSSIIIIDRKAMPFSCERFHLGKFFLIFISETNLFACVNVVCSLLGIIIGNCLHYTGA